MNKEAQDRENVTFLGSPAFHVELKPEHIKIKIYAQARNLWTQCFQLTKTYHTFLSINMDAQHLYLVT
jgi:hypothetical protein